MRFGKTESFRKTLRGLSAPEALRLFNAVRKFEAAWEIRSFPAGLGLKHLRDDFYEFRAGLHDRVLFQRAGDAILYLLYGSHDAIRRFLKTF
ncbi:MAG: hypothetical protein HY922_16075 [Elusimicrobia bacterium]|nr:hypothetical protein [Elusimicrobiota bacterium]